MIYTKQANEIVCFLKSCSNGADINNKTVGDATVLLDYFVLFT